MLNDAQVRVRKCSGQAASKHKQGKVGLVVPEPLASLVRAYRAGEVGDLWQAGYPAWDLGNHRRRAAQPWRHQRTSVSRQASRGSSDRSHAIASDIHQRDKPER